MKRQIVPKTMRTALIGMAVSMAIQAAGHAASNQTTPGAGNARAEAIAQGSPMV